MDKRVGINMKNQAPPLDWVVIKFKKGIMIDKSPCALTYKDASSLSKIGNNLNDGFSYEAYNLKDVPIN